MDFLAAEATAIVTLPVLAAVHSGVTSPAHEIQVVVDVGWTPATATTARFTAAIGLSVVTEDGRKQGESGYSRQVLGRIGRLTAGVPPREFVECASTIKRRRRSYANDATETTASFITARPTTGSLFLPFLQRTEKIHNLTRQKRSSAIKLSLGA